MNELQQSMLQQSNARAVAPEHLEVLGKEAAAKYCCGVLPTLHEAVVEIVKHAQLSPEQVKRVVEFANTEAYLTEFRKEGSPHRVVHFDGGPANPSEVLKDLNDGGGGTVFDPGTGDYDAPPDDRVKTSSARGEMALVNLFSLEPNDVPLAYAQPYQEVVDVHDKLAAAYDNLNGQLGHLELVFDDLQSRLYGQVKQAALNGTSLNGVVQAWSTVAPSEEYVKIAFTLLTDRLIEDGVFDSYEALGDSIVKHASVGVVNREHPIVQDFSTFCETLSKLAQLRQAVEEVKQEQTNVLNFLTKVGETGSGVIKPLLVGFREAGKGVDEFLGGRVGKVVGRGVEYTPHAAAAYGVKHVFDKTGLTPHIKSRIPGTEEYKYRKAMGG